MRKELVMYEPCIDSYPIYGDLFSVLKLTDEAKYWICNNFIQLRKIEPVVFFEAYRSVLYNCPNISVSRVSRKILGHKYNKNLIQLIKDMIDMNYYIFLYVDRLYIKSYGMDHSHTHEFFVYGYDEEREVLLCADNIIGGKYTRFECSMEEVEKAYWGLPEETYLTDIHCISTEFESDRYDTIRIDNIYKLFTEYMDSANTINFGERFRVKDTGFSLQEKEIEKLKGQEIEHVDLRPFCVFKEHKYLMIFRLEMLNNYLKTDDFTQFITAYQTIKNEYRLIISLGIKFNLIHDKILLQRIILHGELAIMSEKNILNSLKMTLMNYLD